MRATRRRPRSGHKRPWPGNAISASSSWRVLAYVPALLSSPGRMPADTKLYLYLDPRRLVSDSIWTFDARQFAGWVPHQMIAYAWPSGPWYVVAQALGLPDWVAHRLWIGTIMLAAGTGVAWAARRLGSLGRGGDRRRAALPALAVPRPVRVADLLDAAAVGRHSGGSSG